MFGKSLYAGKMPNVPWSLPTPPLLRNAAAEGGLDRVLAEAPPGELAGRADPRSPSLHQAFSARLLGLERGHGGCYEVGGNPLVLEPPSDRRITVPAIGQRDSAPRRVAGVVDEAGPLQGADRFLALVLGDPPSLEPVPQPLLGQVAVGDGPKRRAQRPRSPQLARELAQARAVELLARDQPCPDDDFDREGAPARTVQLNGDSAAAGLAEAGDDGHAYFAGAASFAGVAALRGSPPFADASSTVGSSRAETT
jgi:hypothetical protein